MGGATPSRTQFQHDLRSCAGARYWDLHALKPYYEHSLAMGLIRNTKISQNLNYQCVIPPVSSVPNVP